MNKKRSKISELFRVDNKTEDLNYVKCYTFYHLTHLQMICYSCQQSTMYLPGHALRKYNRKRF